MKNKKGSKHKSVEEDKLVFKVKQDLSATAKNYKKLLNENTNLQKELEASYRIKSAIAPKSFPFTVSSKDSEATAVVLASDFHIEEEVPSITVNGLNEYNLKIAEQRTKEFFQNTLKLVQTQQHSVKIDTLVVALLGDFISSSIHDALLEINQLRPIDAIITVQNWLIGGIDYLLTNSKLKLVIPCHMGN